MNLFFRAGLLGWVACTWWLPLAAAEVRVSPGAGTLAAAIASAADGDTLMLEGGTFTGDVTVDKSLDIRPFNRATTSVIDGSMTIHGMGISVTVRSLTVTGAIVLRQAAGVRILENILGGQGVALPIRADEYRTDEGDGSLVIIGNRINGGVRTIRTENAYIAGNTLRDIYVESSAWIVGNRISTTNGVAIDIDGNGAVVRVLGNRVSCRPGTGLARCLGSSRASSLVIANNVIKVEPHASAAAYAVALSGGDVHLTISNNVFQQIPGASTKPVVGVDSSANWGILRSNVFLNFSGSALQTGDEVTVSHNLCFNTDCLDTLGSMIADPLFVDEIDYRLQPNSPAINAGPPDFTVSDLDRSRNDLGVYGGPWSIDQFDSQRDPDSFAPYVYPLFQGGSPFAGGNLDLQAIGAARLR